MNKPEFMRAPNSEIEDLSFLDFSAGCPYHKETQSSAAPAVMDTPFQFPFMPVGQAYDFGKDETGKPLFDPRIFDSQEYVRNPYPYLKLLRDHYPVYYDSLHNCYYVTRYSDITEGYFDEEGFNTIPKGVSNGVLGNTQLELSGVEHRRRRNVYGQHMVGMALDSRVGAIEALADELIARWDTIKDESIIQDRDGVRSVELGRAFANEFPISVVCEILGFPREARSNFYYWYKSMMTGLGGSATEKQGLEARQHLQDYVETLVAERREKPTYLQDSKGKTLAKDIISKLCESKLDGDYLSTEEITSNIALIVGGGGETTRGAILNMWYLLLQNPDQFNAVAKDVKLWSNAFHETLRIAVAPCCQPRHNTFDIEMHGMKIPAGSLIIMMDFSANHDERVFKDPTKFDIFRDDLYTGRILRSGYNKDGRSSHMAFGVGPHLCPGAWVSHQESVLGSARLAKHLKNPRLNYDRMPKDIDGVSLAPIPLFAMTELWIDCDLD